MDHDYTLRCYEDNIRGIAQDFFRARMECPDSFPIDQVGERAIIVVANHSGMGLSWDNIILDFLIYDLLLRRFGDPVMAIGHKPVRLVDPLLISHRTVTPFGIADWWKRIGCVPATYQAFEQAVVARRIVLVSPEGVAGIAKGPHRRYQLQRFSTSFLRLAHRHGALIVPVSVVNGEYLNPLNLSFATINRIGRRLGFPFVPIGLGALQAMLPAAYLAPFPARLTYVVDPAVDVAPSADIPSSDVLRAEAQSFRRCHQLRLKRDVACYHQPYDLVSWLRHLRAARDRRALIPLFWPGMFLRAAGEPRWLAVLYAIPFGYPLIRIARHVIRRSARRSP